MAPLSLKIVHGGGAITRTLLFDSTMRVSEAHDIVREKVLLDGPGKDYGLFLTSADDELSGVWLEGYRTLDYYMLRDGDSLQYLCRTRNLRIRMLDGTEKTMQIDESKSVSELMVVICNKIGITNHEEYGLCFEEEEKQTQEEKPATGTLTLRRKQPTREKDAKLEQLSKKLKTDDNVEWLAQHKTLREIGVDPKERLLLKRRLFYSDRNVDSRDPVQLNLLYVQTRDAILDGRQVVTEAKAIEFAGIQCQVQYGDFQEEKHKPGFIENLKEFLSEQYANSRGVERKVLKEFSRHHGLSPLEAKHLYTKTARELPTYGVTFFLVKEQQKGKKKLVPRLLGINAESILRLDEVTKEILQVWMLTQVKTFRAGKETFTLDFGDYSDKEYTVKTNEAHRIRDILQGYIDIIHRSVATPFNVVPDEGQAICEENVQSSKGQIIETVGPKKLIKHSYIGPSNLVPLAQGCEATQGTQIVTVNQMLVTKPGVVRRRGVAGGAGERGVNSTEYLKKLNRVNSNAMETVEFLTDPNNQRAQKVSKVTALATIIEEEMNSIIEGIHRSVEKDNEEVRKKLLSELDELCANFNVLLNTSKRDDFGSPESLTTSQETAEKIVVLCTGMFCALDPGIKRRSRILKRSHQSFIADEKTEATLRRASFLAAASHACKAVDKAKEGLDTMFEGSVPEVHEIQNLEREARKKVGKLNAAVAILLSAQADPDNLDYTAAITSMTTIDELLPELIQDAKALGSGKDERSRLSLLSRIRSLCDAAHSICALTGEEDKERLQELAYRYAKSADKLIFTFGRGTVADKENEILDLARDIGDKTSMLLMKTHELINLAQSDPRADELDRAGARCADDSRILLACAQLTASSIDESHCQSAMTAAAESLTSSAQHLTATWKPLVEEPGRRMYEHSLSDLTTDLMKALDRLRNAYADLSSEGVRPAEDRAKIGDDVKQKERMKFLATMTTASNNIADAQMELDKPMKEEIDGQRAKELQRLLAQRLAQLNSAIASLICATADRQNPDYKTAEQAIAIVSDLMPALVRDLKAMSTTNDEKAGRALLNDARALCEATRDLCAVNESGNIQDENDAASKFARFSSKLSYVFTPRVDPRKGNMIIELSKTCCEKASQLLTHVNQLVDEEGATGDAGEEGAALLDERGAALVDVVQALLTAAQITAPSFGDPRCQSTMLTAADDVSSSCQELAAIWCPLVKNPTRATLQQNLDSSRKELEASLNNLRDACKDLDVSDRNNTYTDQFNDEIRERTSTENNTTKAKSKEIIRDLKWVGNSCTGVFNIASEICDGAKQLASSLGEDGEHIGDCGERLLDTAQALYATVAKVMQSCGDPPDLFSIVAAAEAVSSSSMELATAYGPVDQDAAHAEIVGKIVHGRELLASSLKEIENACLEMIDVSKTPQDADETTAAWLTQIQSMSETKRALEQMYEELDTPMTGRTPEVKISELERDAVRRLGCLDSAVATVVRAYSAKRPDYDGAEKATKSILEVMPLIITDVKLLSANQDEEHRRNAMGELKTLHSATLALVDAVENENDKDLKEAQSAYAVASQKLNATIAPTADIRKTKQIQSLSLVARERASELLGDLEAVLKSRSSDDLDPSLDKVVDAMRNFLNTAQILPIHIEINIKHSKNTADTASDVSCKFELLSSAENLEECCKELSSSWRQLESNPMRRQLEARLRDLDAAISALKAAYHGPDETNSDEDRLKFIATLSAAKNNVQSAHELINKPSATLPLMTGADLQRLLAQRLAQLNSAIASLIQSADHENLNYVEADKASKAIAKLLPAIIRDSNALTNDDASGRDLMSKLRSLCDATRELCLEAELGQAKRANDSISKFVDASNKLRYVFNPRADAKRENVVMELCKEINNRASSLKSPALVDAAQGLLTVAQITACSIEDPNCQSTLLSSVNEMLSLSRQLDNASSSPLPDTLKKKMNQERSKLEDALNEIKAVCKDASDATLRPVKPPVPKRMSSTEVDQGQLLAEKQHLAQSVDEAIRSIQNVENEITKISVDGAEIISPEAIQVASEQLERKLSLASVAVSHLVYCNDPRKMNYKVAAKSAKSLSELFPTVVKEVRQLNSSDIKRSKTILDNTVLLCEATRALCSTAKNDSERLNEVAVDYANSSAKLLYSIGTGADPNQEKEVLARAKAVGDCAWRLATEGASSAQLLAADDARDLCAGGSRCADAAGKLLYVAKLVAPSIQYPESQNILLTAADQLSTRVKHFSSILTPLKSHPEHSNHLDDLENEGQSLEKLLNDLKADVKDKKLVKRKNVEVLTIENTPMRQLANEILNNYKAYVESPTLDMEGRRRYAQDADRLAAAVEELDVADAVCRKSPQDVNTLRRLENATQDLQHTLLHRRGDQSNVVDLMDFVKDVISNVAAVSKSADDYSRQHAGVQIQSIKVECNKMSAGAMKLTEPAAEEATLNEDLFRIETFAQDCHKAVSLVDSAARSLPDVMSRRELQLKAQRLTDSVNLLRFAAKSALATANSAALDETLADLTEMEKRLGDLLKPIPGVKQPQHIKERSPAAQRLRLSASSLRRAQDVAPALAGYVTEQRACADLNDPRHKRILEEHLRRRLLLASKLFKSWKTSNQSDSSEEKQEGKAIDNGYVRRLLFPPKVGLIGNNKSELTKRYHQAKGKFDSIIGGIASNVDKPEKLCTSIHATADVAIELDNIARALGNTEEHMQSVRIEESARHMRFATVKLLKDADQLSKEPNSMLKRRKLLDAIRSLNDAINNLSRAADSAYSGDESIGNLRLQQNLLQTLHPTCSLSYAECLDTLQSQADVITNIWDDVGRSVSLKQLPSAASQAADCAMHCAYLISISDKYKETAKGGLLDVSAIIKAIESIQDNCVRVICSGDMNQAKDIEAELSEKARQIQDAVAESKGKIDLDVERELLEVADEVDTAMSEYRESVHIPNSDATRTSTYALRLSDAAAALKAQCLRPELTPTAAQPAPDTIAACDLLISNARELLSKTAELIDGRKTIEKGAASRATFDASKASVVQAFDTLLSNVTEHGRLAGLLESSQIEEEEQEIRNKSYIATQMDLATKWLKSPTFSEAAKSSGIEGIKNVVKVAKETVEDLKDLDNEEMRQVIEEVEKLSEEVSSKCNKEKSRILMERLLELRKMMGRVLVARVVEEFLEGDAQIDDLDLMLDHDKEAHLAKRHRVLERSARAVRTARLAATSATAATALSLIRTTAQVELLAPSLVKAIEERIQSPNKQEIIENYKALMTEYANTMSIVQSLCDQSIDPVDFVQAAGETMHRLYEESRALQDPLKCTHTDVVTRLGRRAVEAALGSRQARADPELRRALALAQSRLADSASRTRQRDWRQVAAEILQTTSEVESALSGENIFQKEHDPNQPIFAAALDLHAAVREWSAKDNEIVAVAKRMAVLMARLSNYMNHDKKREVIASSKSIVKASSEVAALARALALECSDRRIRANLLQLCDRIPTISGQLKMLTTVKGSSLGQQGNQEDKEAINMLVGNAQNLMQSIQEVVAAAAAASVKIMSQRGARIRWVRKNYYNY
ncbi:unnamed protein product, partial [Iphiclides podalirius]